MLPALFTIPVYPVCMTLTMLTGCLLLWPGLNKAGLTPLCRVLLLPALTAAFLIGARLWNLVIAPNNYGGHLHWYSLRWSGLSLYDCWPRCRRPG